MAGYRTGADEDITECNKKHNLVTMSFINIFLSMLIYLSNNK
jgi:hypothetical protein